MKKNKLFLMLTMLIAAFVLSSCSKSVPDYAKLIPEDASVVLRLDIRQIAKKSGSGDDKVNKKLEKAVKERFNGKLKEKMLAILDDPAEAGLDLRDPVFVYRCEEREGKREREEFGIVGAVYKESKFTDLLNVIAQESGADEVKKDGDLSYIVLSKALITFNDDWFHIGPFNGDDAKAAAKAIAKRYDSESGSIVKDEGFVKMCKKRGLAQLYLRGDDLYERAQQDCYIDYYVDEFDDDPPTYQPTNPFDEINDYLGVDIKNFSVVLDLTMRNGEGSISAELVAKNAEGKKQMKETDKMMGGKKEGFFFRFNFGIIDKIAEQFDSYNAQQAKLLTKLVKFAELKYDGDCKFTLRVVTNDKSKTPLQSIVNILKKEYGL